MGAKKRPSAARSRAAMATPPSVPNRSSSCSGSARASTAAHPSDSARCTGAPAASSTSVRSSRGSRTLPTARPPSAGSPPSSSVHTVDGIPERTAPASPACSVPARTRRTLRPLPEIGVVFDCDGTLVDSEPLSGEAWRTVLDPFGYRITEEDERQVVGRTFSFTHAYLSERVDLPDAETTWAQVRTELFRLIDTRLEAFADAVVAVADLQVRGVRLAVASSSGRERLDRTLARAGLAFDISIAGDEVAHGKPAPDMFLLAAERLQVDPSRCVVVEDSPPGIEAGIAAGMPTLAVCRVDGTEAALAKANRIVHLVSAEAIL